MRSIKAIGLGIVAVLALAVSASAASAVEFHYTGSITTPLLGEATGTQTFTAGFGSVECTKLTVSGSIEHEKSATQAAVVTYSSCKANIGTVKEPIVADYTFNANGNVEVTKEIAFEIEGICTLKIPNQTISSAVTYGSASEKLGITAAAKNIKYNSGGNFLCGEGSTATYSGTSSVMGESKGTLSVS